MILCNIASREKINVYRKKSIKSLLTNWRGITKKYITNIHIKIKSDKDQLQKISHFSILNYPSEKKYLSPRQDKKEGEYWNEGEKIYCVFWNWSELTSKLQADRFNLNPNTASFIIFLNKLISPRHMKKQKEKTLVSVSSVQFQIACNIVIEYC